MYVCVSMSSPYQHTYIVHMVHIKTVLSKRGNEGIDILSGDRGSVSGGWFAGH